MQTTRILIIDDEPQIQKLLELTLKTQFNEVVTASTSAEGLQIAASRMPDLIILDIGLPDENGLVTLDKLRTWYNQPIVILSVFNSEKNIVSALDKGANDYVVKPFRTGELLARVRSALRNAAKETMTHIFQFDDLEMDFSTHTIKKNGAFVKLTSTQYELLGLFVQNEGKVLTYSYLLNKIWGPDYIDQIQYLRVFVAQLRRKIEDSSDDHRFIKTESGIGYRFVGS